MKVKELIAALKEKDQDLEVEFVTSLIEHTCGGDDRCYCSYEDTYFFIGAVAESKRYNKYTKKQQPIKICLQGDKV